MHNNQRVFGNSTLAWKPVMAAVQTMDKFHRNLLHLQAVKRDRFVLDMQGISFCLTY